MGYSQLADVKEVLRIDATDTASDSELANCITSADGLIDSLLKSHSFTVPLDSPYPDPIKDASKNFAAWIFRARDAPPNENQVLFFLGTKFLNAYMEGETDLPTLVRET
jgi:hypothetical protein